MLQGEYLVEAVRSPQFQARFWAKVRKTDGCWIWTGARNPNGCGRISVGARGAGLALAPRASWILAHGAIPAGLHVCHHCDNPPCVRPDHLFLGSGADNTHDMMMKGRNGYGVNRGEENGAARLTSAAVLEIRKRRARGATLQSLACEYGVGKSSVHRIARGKNWRHLL